jgi:HK97 family phage portal protein
VIFDVFKKDSPILDSRTLWEFLSRSSSSSAGVDVTPTRAMQHASVFSCVRVIAESLGQLPLHLYKQQGRNKNKATDHRLYSLLHDSPNGYQTAQEFFEMIGAHLALRGNFYAYINRTTRGVGELLPLNPGAVVPRLLTDGATVVYQVTFWDGSTDVLDASKVFHVPLFSLDGYTGLSPVTYARETIGLSIATEEHGARLFSNGAKPGGVLQSDQSLKKDQIDLIREQFEELHKGNENAHRIAVLGGGLKWAQVGLSAEDSQFLETRKYQRSEIAGIFRVPPHMIGDLERATFSNIEHQGLSFVTLSLMPYLRRIEQRIWMQLLTPPEQSTYFAKFNAAGLLRGDMVARSNFYKSGINDGWLVRNEARESEDLNPIDGLDIPLMPLNMTDGREPPEDPAEADPADPAAAEPNPGAAAEG